MFSKKKLITDDGIGECQRSADALAETVGHASDALAELSRAIRSVREDSLIISCSPEVLPHK